jgi:hypothetical protein
MLYLCRIEFRPNDLALPRDPRWTNDLLQISKHRPGCAAAAYVNTHLKEVLYDARYGKVVQWPKRLRLYSA